MPLKADASKMRLNVGNLQTLKLGLQEEVLDQEDLPKLLELVTMIEEVCTSNIDVDQNLLLASFFAERAKVTVVDRLKATSFAGCDQVTRADDAHANALRLCTVDIKNLIRKARIGRGLRVPNGPRG